MRDYLSVKQQATPSLNKIYFTFKGYVEDKDSTLRVATKFVNVAKAHYAAKNRDVEIIKLNGSIELGPILGLSHVIVDIVETGNTLKANNLEVIEQFKDISARFIANKSSFKFQNKEITEMVDKLAAVVRARKEK